MSIATNPRLVAAVHEEILKAVKVRCASVVPDEISRSLRLELKDLADYTAAGLVAQLEAFLYGEEASHSVQFSAPADWWQHFKDRWFPHWLRKRFPVQYRTQTTTMHAAKLFPHAKPNKFGDPIIRILSIDRRNWSLA